jgi:hypothetical protein
METPLDGLIRTLKDVDEDLNILVIDAAETLQGLILDLQRKQLFAGVKGTEERILPPYTEFTKQKKRQKGQPINRVTWFDTGELYGNLVTERQDEAIFIGADDTKFRRLSIKYGNDVLGLTQDNIQALTPEVKIQLLAIIKRLIKKTKK